MAWDVWCIDWGGIQDSAFTHILFSSWLSRPEPAIGRQAEEHHVPLLFKEARNRFPPRGKEVFEEPSQAVVGQGDIAPLFFDGLEFSRVRGPGKRPPIADQDICAGFRPRGRGV